MSCLENLGMLFVSRGLRLELLIVTFELFIVLPPFNPHPVVRES